MANDVDFEFELFTDGPSGTQDIKNVTDDMADFLQKDTTQDIRSEGMKLATCDIQGGPALGMIVWCNSRPEELEYDYALWTVYQQQGNANTSNMKSEFNKLVNVLNTGKFDDNRRRLSYAQAYHSQISISSYGSGNYSLNLWYPTEPERRRRRR